ncbi:MAG TPA: hypothetical protein ENJ79_01290 [Gammaproteobacteria bacterium]|nr:hypothetical protein [Gammaproteobacteria bacterium]
MTEDPPIRLDEQGIPILETAVAGTEAEDAWLTDPEQVEPLLNEAQIGQLIDDLADDLRKLVSWKIETLIKEELGRLLQEASERGSEKLAGDIRTQLRLALPELLAGVVRAARKTD